MENIYRFRTALKGIKPSIWRLIDVSETYTFKELHEAIQDAMGWNDCHLYVFEIRGVEISDTKRAGESGYLDANKKKMY